MAAITFTEADLINLELVRQIVFRRLKADKGWDHLYDGWEQRHVSEYVTFNHDHHRKAFTVLVLEVMWQLIAQGVVTPGKDYSNVELPWFRVTNYGKKVLETERFVPHDPAGYLSEVEAVAKSDVGRAALPYLGEALRCFTSGCHVASVLMLGIAAEAVFLGLCGVVINALNNGTERSKFEKFRWVKEKHRWIVDKYQGLPDRKTLPESLDMTLTSLYELIRRQRNDLGHPSDKLPDINRELAFVFFRLFPTFVQDIEQFAVYCRKQGL